MLSSLVPLIACFAAVSAAPASLDGVVPGKFIVTLQPALDTDLDLHARWVSDIHSQSLARRGGSFGGLEKTYSFPGFQAYSGSFDEETIEILKANSSVLEVEPERVFTVTSMTTQEKPPWGLSAISHANPISSSSSYVYDSSAGKDSFAYVLDSGILLEHVEFEGRAILGLNAWKGTSDKGHGTHVAAIVGGATFGVAKKATIIDVQITGTDSGSTESMLSGLSWTVNDAVSKKRIGKAVINMSVGSSKSTAVNSAVQAAIDAGITVVTSAGNSNDDAANYSPSGLASVITVAASNKDYKRWQWSSWGTIVDFMAPGQDVTSAWSTSTTATYTTSGTSQASPHVAGLVAYLLTLEGPRTPAQMVARLKELAIKDKISDTKGVPNLLIYNGNGQ